MFYEIFMSNRKILLKLLQLKSISKKREFTARFICEHIHICILFKRHTESIDIFVFPKK